MPKEQDKEKMLKTNAEVRVMRAMETVLQSRASLMKRLGQAFGGDRDVYTTLGYPLNLTFDDYYALWTREGIAKRVVKAFPEATWRGEPSLTVLNKPDKENATVKKWNKMVKKLRLYHYFQRVDVLSGIGRYGVLFLGFSDGKDLDQEVSKEGSNEINYLVPYMERSVQIKSYVSDPKNPRFGLPEMYTIQMAGADGITSGKNDTQVSRDVHWTRCIHVAEGKEENEILGTPRLEPVFNYMKNIEKVAGGSAEMFWLGAYNGIVAEADKDAEIDDVDGLNDEIENYVHKMKRFLLVQGIKVKNLAPNIASPWEPLRAQLTLTSGTTGIPSRILLGSERGELASIMDENNWNTRVDERRLDFAESQIMYPFIQRCMEYGVLPVEEDWSILWPSLESDDEKRKSEVVLNMSEAIATFVESQSYLFMPLDMYLSVVWKYSEEEIQEFKNNYPMAFEDDDIGELRDKLLLSKTGAMTDVSTDESEEPDTESEDTGEDQA